MTLRKRMEAVLARVKSHELKDGQHEFQEFSRHIYKPIDTPDGSYVQYTLNKFKTDEELEEAYARWQLEKGET